MGRGEAEIATARTGTQTRDLSSGFQFSNHCTTPSTLSDLSYEFDLPVSSTTGKLTLSSWVGCHHSAPPVASKLLVRPLRFQHNSLGQLSLSCKVGCHDSASLVLSLLLVPPLRFCLGGVYVPCIYSHAGWSHRKRCRSLSLGPLSVERHYFLLFVDLPSVSSMTLPHNWRSPLRLVATTVLLSPIRVRPSPFPAIPSRTSDSPLLHGLLVKADSTLLVRSQLRIRPLCLQLNSLLQLELFSAFGCHDSDLALSQLRVRPLRFQHDPSRRLTLSSRVPWHDSNPLVLFQLRVRPLRFQHDPPRQLTLSSRVGCHDNKLVLGLRFQSEDSVFRSAAQSHAAPQRLSVM